MRIWVSGSAGTLGAEVCRQLRGAGHAVIEADLAGDPAVDLLDPGQVADSLAGADAVAHCAGVPSPEGIAPDRLVQVNTMTTFNALEQAWAAGIRTAVLASSGSIYGSAWSPSPMPFAEVPVDEDTPLRYVDQYALSKDLFERTGAMYARRGMSVTALRFHWILRPEQAREQVTKGDTDEQLRNLWGYVDLTDAARACVLALEPRTTRQAFETPLIASDRTLSDRPTEELLEEHFPDVVRRRRMPGTQSAFDCSRAAAVLGWRPTRGG